ncbi:MAG: stage V sporulation protein AE [Christensenellales bacterium]|jgi:stage V sporulation protein AE
MTEIFWNLVKAFLVGGAICAIGQIFFERTKMLPAQVLVLFVTAGVILSAIGLYQPLVDFAGAGASVPLCGFGNTLAQGAIKAVGEHGWLGAITGGAVAAAGGVSAAIFFGYLNGVIFKPKSKR